MKAEISLPKEALDQKGRIVIDFDANLNPAHWLEPEDYQVVSLYEDDKITVRVEVPNCQFRVEEGEGWICTYGDKYYPLWEEGYDQRLHCAWCAIYGPFSVGFD